MRGDGTGDGPTLREGIAIHLRAMRARGASDRSLSTLEGEQMRHLVDRLDRPLASLSRHEVATRHEMLTVTSGPWLANRVLQQLRAVYNTAARRFEHLSPTNPTLAVTYNRLRRRREPSLGRTSRPGASRSRRCATPCAATCSGPCS